ncbi:MAG: hypothetical protein CMJ47_14320 [Planctomyces sp.]|nr:hypothetical protein [Planctomyces sp.]
MNEPESNWFDPFRRSQVPPPGGTPCAPDSWDESFLELLNALPGTAYRCENDKDWTMILISRNCVDLTGYSSEELTANKRLSYNDLIHPDDRNRVWRTIQFALERREEYTLQYRILHRDGYIRWVWERGCGAFDRQGHLRWLQGMVLADEARASLEKKQSSKDSPLNSDVDNKDLLAHDLGNLLSVIRNYANVIRQSGRSSQPTPYAEKIVDTTTRAADMLSRLLKMQPGTQPVRALPTSQLLDDLEPMLSGLFGDRIQLVLDCQTTDWKIALDVMQFERAVMNLAANAAQSIDADESGIVTVTAREVSPVEPVRCFNGQLPPGDYICISVRDTGRGMSVTQTVKAFEPRYSTRPGGRGLGLPMVLSFAQQSHGGVQITSERGEGTEVSLYLPRSLEQSLPVPPTV